MGSTYPSAHQQAPSTMACLYSRGAQCWWGKVTNTCAPPSSISSVPKHPSIQDEEESFNDSNSQVWTVPDALIEVPVPLLADPTDVVPAAIDNGPRHSAHVHAPSSKAAEVQGIQHLPHVTQAVAESCEVGCRLKKQHAQAKFERQQQILDSPMSLPQPPLLPPFLPMLCLVTCHLMIPCITHPPSIRMLTLLLFVKHMPLNWLPS